METRGVALAAAGGKAPLLLGKGQGKGGGGGAGAEGGVGVVLGGLEPYTAYAYRLVAHNALGESRCVHVRALVRVRLSANPNRDPGLGRLGAAPAPDANPNPQPQPLP